MDVLALWAEDNAPCEGFCDIERGSFHRDLRNQSEKEPVALCILHYIGHGIPRMVLRFRDLVSMSNSHNGFRTHTTVQDGDV